MLKETHSKIIAFRNYTHDIDKVDIRADRWKGTARHLMSQFGFHPVGSGNYGYVFVNYQYPYVVKLFMKDVAYIKWLNFCIQNQNNPYIPKIRGKLVQLSNLFYAVRMEKLVSALDYAEKDYVIQPLVQKLSNPKHYWNDSDSNLRHILSFLSKHEDMLDIHLGNIMWRGAHQPVITDPLYNFFDPDSGFLVDPNKISALIN